VVELLAPVPVLIELVVLVVSSPPHAKGKQADTAVRMAR
jgi:hypothetical protein